MHILGEAGGGNTSLGGLILFQLSQAVVLLAVGLPFFPHPLLPSSYFSPFLLSLLPPFFSFFLGNETEYISLFCLACQP